MSSQDSKAESHSTSLPDDTKRMVNLLLPSRRVQLAGCLTYCQARLPPLQDSNEDTSKHYFSELEV